jgi:hypothetical protein
MLERSLQHVEIPFALTLRPLYSLGDNPKTFA